MEFDGPSHFFASGAPTGATTGATSVTARSRSHQRAVLGVGQVPRSRREGAESEEQAGCARKGTRLKPCLA